MLAAVRREHAGELRPAGHTDDDDEDLEDEEEGDVDDDDTLPIGDPPVDEDVRTAEEELEPVSPFELDVDHEDVEVPPAIARRLAEAPVPAIKIPPLKSKDAIASMAKRGQQTGELERRLSPWERPREGFSSAMGVKHGESPLGPGWAGKRAEKV